MGDNIKTELEFADKRYSGEMQPSKQWVDLSWLKGQIEKELNLNEVSGPDDSKIIILSWILRLLEG